jgi:CTD small phosphatase-like protein 2
MKIYSKRIRSSFFHTGMICLYNLNEINYIELRRIVRRGLLFAVNQSTTEAATLHQRHNSCKNISLPSISTKKGYTLVLDLDETLVCATSVSNTLNDCIVNIRPGAKEFIEEMSKHYELVIFTAGTKDYADYALKFVDPRGRIVHRLYREHVTQKGNIAVKDISKLGRDLKKMIIIDNVAENFQLQAANGIFIKTWENDEKDTSLTDLMPILKQIVELKVPDVRVALRHYRDYQMRKVINSV